MKNKMMITVVMVAATLTQVFGSGENEPSRAAADVSKSEITWHGKKVTGEHFGKISLKNGAFQVSNGELSGGSFTIDMRSITNTDLKDEGMNNKLVGHLKSDDFFGVEKYPEAILKIEKIEEHEDGNYHMTGKITIKGTTKEIEFPATVSDLGSSYSAAANLIIDRSEFDVRYGSGSFFDNLGDKMIYDEFELKITLVANK